MKKPRSAVIILATWLSFLAAGLSYAHESHLSNIRQLTFGGKNAEAYFSFDGSKLIFQSTRPTTTGGPFNECYQIYVMELATMKVDLMSNGRGGTTCAYFLADRRHFIYSSTSHISEQCPKEPAASGRYQWILNPFDIFLATLDGVSERRITDNPGYDAEATISPDGETIVFTSLGDGDLDLYLMDKDGGNQRRLTKDYGYDGGAFFSPDGKKLVYRGSHPQTPEAKANYRELLERNIVEPNDMQIFVTASDGSWKKQVTSNAGANFAPFYHPDNKRIIFSSNLAATGPGRPSFNLYLIDEDGIGLEQITSIGSFNSFPMFSPDGKKLVWTSDRNARERGEFNLFVADWLP